MQDSYARMGKATPCPIDFKMFLITIIIQLPAIIKHEWFSTCSENKNRKISHMMVAIAYYHYGKEEK